MNCLKKSSYLLCLRKECISNYTYILQNAPQGRKYNAMADNLKGQTSGIQTFVFFDIEATGLPSKVFRTRITELSLISSHRNHIIYNNDRGVPRVSNKLSICVNPRKLIEYDASEITGLTNILLETENEFDAHLFDTLKSYFGRLPQPICLVAHNGNNYDFPILKSEIEYLKKEFPDHLLCADSLIAFRELLGKNDESSVVHHQGQLSSPQTTDRKLETFSHAQNGMQTPVKRPKLEPYACISGVSPLENLSQEITSMDMPDFAHNLLSTPSKHDNTLFEVSEMSVMSPLETTPEKQRIPNKTFMPTPVKKNYQSFKLVDIYRCLARKEPINSHRAEGDTLMLLECVVALGDQFTNWADQNAKKFNEVKKMW